MRLTEDEARRRLAAYDHGVLATVHPIRGVDTVPVVYAVHPDGLVGIPIDRVKPKAGGPLQRERNLMADPRATLLVDHWDATDWTRLWWVRAELRWEPRESAAYESDITRVLVERYPQYVNAPFDRILIFPIGHLSGWSGAL